MTFPERVVIGHVTVTWLQVTAGLSRLLRVSPTGLSRSLIKLFHQISISMKNMQVMWYVSTLKHLHLVFSTKWNTEHGGVPDNSQDGGPSRDPYVRRSPCPALVSYSWRTTGAGSILRIFWTPQHSPPVPSRLLPSLPSPRLSSSPLHSP